MILSLLKEDNLTIAFYFFKKKLPFFQSSWERENQTEQTRNATSPSLSSAFMHHCPDFNHEVSHIRSIHKEKDTYFGTSIFKMLVHIEDLNCNINVLALSHIIAYIPQGSYVLCLQV